MACLGVRFKQRRHGRQEGTHGVRASWRGAAGRYARGARPGRRTGRLVGVSLGRPGRKLARPNLGVVREPGDLAARAVPGRRPRPRPQGRRSARHRRVYRRVVRPGRRRQPERPLRRADAIPTRDDAGRRAAGARLADAELRPAARTDGDLRYRQRLRPAADHPRHRRVVPDPPTRPRDGHQADRCGASRDDLRRDRAAARAGLWLARHHPRARASDRGLRPHRLARLPRSSGRATGDGSRGAAGVRHGATQPKPAAAFRGHAAVRRRCSFRWLDSWSCSSATGSA